MPIHAPVHCQPISKLESLKTALDTYETTGQLVQVSQLTDWISNMVVREREHPYQSTKNQNMPRPFQDSEQGHPMPKIYHLHIGREPSQITRHEIHDRNRHQRSLPEHPSDITIIPDDHHVYTMGPLQVDKTTVWHIFNT